jgi:hypothetical protein
MLHQPASRLSRMLCFPITRLPNKQRGVCWGLESLSPARWKAGHELYGSAVSGFGTAADDKEMAQAPSVRHDHGADGIGGRVLPPEVKTGGAMVLGLTAPPCGSVGRIGHGIPSRV